MKIIFLDIDGVLLSQKWLREQKGKKHKILTKSAVSALQHIIKQTKAKIVISSTWRLNNSLDDIVSMFNENGIYADFIGVTKQLNFSNSNDNVPRGCEIHQWLSDNKSLLGCKIQSFKKYIILDDDSDMLYWQRNNFIRVDSEVGLTKVQAEKAIAILNATLIEQQMSTLDKVKALQKQYSDAVTGFEEFMQANKDNAVYYQLLDNNINIYREFSLSLKEISDALVLDSLANKQYVESLKKTDL